MLEWWLDAYRDPMFRLFPVATSGVAVAAFLLFAVPLTWIAWRDPAWARPYRVQARRPPADRVIGPSLRHLARNSATVLVFVVALWPLLRLGGVHAGPLPPAWELLGQVLLFVYVDDFLYYWSHRAMHTPWLYRRVHSVHHRMVTPWAIAGNYMHPLEYAVTSGLVLLGPLALGSHVVTVWTWVAFRQWEAAEGHSGYDFPWNPSRLFPGYGPGFHDFHHARFVGNYSGFLSWADRLFGTLSEGYGEYRRILPRVRPPAAGAGPGAPE